MPPGECPVYSRRTTSTLPAPRSEGRSREHRPPRKPAPSTQDRQQIAKSLVSVARKPQMLFYSSKSTDLGWCGIKPMRRERCHTSTSPFAY